MSPRRLAAALLALACGATASGGEIALVGLAVDAQGNVLRQTRADEPVNPASVVKLATTLWALERLGPEHRFATGFAVDGEVGDGGTLTGTLIAVGGADPDFHVENAVLVAGELARAGIAAVDGTVSATDDFWLGWEGGSERRIADPEKRRTQMAKRLVEAIDGARRDAGARRAVEELCARRGWQSCPSTGLSVSGAAAGHETAVDTRPLIVHRSNPLPSILDRFNTWSNNDIERLAEVLGSPRELARFLEERWGAEDAAGIRFSTLSGLDHNRMTPRQMVRLVRDLDAAARTRGLSLTALTGTAGCDEGTLDRFRRLAATPGSVTGKTGTLVQTDGGVVALAGVAETAEGPVFFAVAAPRNGARLRAARAAQEQWILSVAGKRGGLRAAECPPPPPHSDRDVRLERP